MKSAAKGGRALGALLQWKEEGEVRARVAPPNAPELNHAYPFCRLSHSAKILCIASSPSNNAAGPGCKMIGDLIS